MAFAGGEFLKEEETRELVDYIFTKMETSVLKDIHFNVLNDFDEKEFSLTTIKKYIKRIIAELKKDIAFINTFNSNCEYFTSLSDKKDKKIYISSDDLTTYELIADLQETRNSTQELIDSLSFVLNFIEKSIDRARNIDDNDSTWEF